MVDLIGRMLLSGVGLAAPKWRRRLNASVGPLRRRHCRASTFDCDIDSMRRGAGRETTGSEACPGHQNADANSHGPQRALVDGFPIRYVRRITSAPRPGHQRRLLPRESGADRRHQHLRRQVGKRSPLSRSDLVLWCILPVSRTAASGGLIVNPSERVGCQQGPALPPLAHLNGDRPIAIRGASFQDRALSSASLRTKPRTGSSRFA